MHHTINWVKFPQVDLVMKCRVRIVLGCADTDNLKQCLQHRPNSGRCIKTAVCYLEEYSAVLTVLCSVLTSLDIGLASACRNISGKISLRPSMNSANPGARCKSKTGRHNQDRSRRATNHRRILTRPVLDLERAPGGEASCPRLVWMKWHTLISRVLFTF